MCVCVCMASSIMYFSNTMFNSPPLLTDSPDLRALNLVANAFDDMHTDEAEEACGTHPTSTARLTSDTPISHPTLTTAGITSFGASHTSHVPAMSHARVSSSDAMPSSISQSFLAVTEADVNEASARYSHSPTRQHHQHHPHHYQLRSSPHRVDTIVHSAHDVDMSERAEHSHDSAARTAAGMSTNAAAAAAAQTARTATTTTEAEAEEAAATQNASHNLYVASLPPNCNDNMLLNLFEPFGPILSAKVMLHRGSNRCKGYGFVFFKFREDAERAQTAMIGYVVGGNRIQVRHARPTSTNTLVHDVGRSGKRSESTGTSHNTTMASHAVVSYSDCYGAPPPPSGDHSVALVAAGSVLTHPSSSAAASALVGPAMYPIMSTPTPPLMTPGQQQNCFNSVLPYYTTQPQPPTAHGASPLTTNTAAVTSPSYAGVHAVMNNTAAIPLTGGLTVPAPPPSQQPPMCWPGLAAAAMPGSEFALPSGHQQQQQQQQVVYMLVPMQQGMSGPGLLPYS